MTGNNFRKRSFSPIINVYCILFLSFSCFASICGYPTFVFSQSEVDSLQAHNHSKTGGLIDVVKAMRQTYSGNQVVDENTPAVQYIHLIPPNSKVDLYLHADAFPKMFYTEMGKHNHGGSTGKGSPHKHRVKITDNDDQRGCNKHCNTNTDDEAEHTHPIKDVGNPTIAAEDNNIEAINSLQIWIMGKDWTKDLLKQSKESQFGNGRIDDNFSKNGSGRIDITECINWEKVFYENGGELKIEFKQPKLAGKPKAGGILRWEIYVYSDFEKFVATTR